jgi:hypothetical protein
MDHGSISHGRIVGSVLAGRKDEFPSDSDTAVSSSVFWRGDDYEALTERPRAQPRSASSRTTGPHRRSVAAAWRGNSAGWGSAEVLGTLAGGILLAITFVLTELRTKEPILPMRRFRSRARAASDRLVAAPSWHLLGARISACEHGEAVGTYQQSVVDWLSVIARWRC